MLNTIILLALLAGGIGFTWWAVKQTLNEDKNKSKSWRNRKR